LTQFQIHSEKVLIWVSIATLKANGPIQDCSNYFIMQFMRSTKVQKQRRSDQNFAKLYEEEQLRYASRLEAISTSDF